MAPANLAPAWPLPSVVPDFSTTSFGGGRPWGCNAATCERWHAGVDLTDAPDGALVVAPLAGTIVGTDRGWSGAAKALYLRTDGGLFLVLGGLKAGSPASLGVAAGTRVKRGQPVGRVLGSYGMIHLETYRDPSATRQANTPWPVSEKPPTNLLNPIAFVQSMTTSSPAVATAGGGGGAVVVVALVLLWATLR